MTAVAVVELGTFKVASKQSGLSLMLSSSFSLSLPSLWPTGNTAAELSESSEAGDIWISKAGSCKVEFLTTAASGAPEISSYNADSALAIISRASECPIWGDLGLALKIDHSPFAAPTAPCGPRASYFLHHPDLSSNTIAPRDVPVAQFHGIKIGLNVQTNAGSNGSKAVVDQASEDAVNSASTSAQGHTYGLRRNPRLTKKALAAQEDSALRLSDTKECQAPLSTSQTASFDMISLLDAGIRRIIGVRGTPPGIRTSKEKAFPSLIGIAPAVWNLQYLQSMAVHAQAIPILANGISRLMNARSASLREKVAKLGCLSTPHYQNSEADDVEDRIKDETRRRLWSLCQTGIQADPVIKTNDRKKTHLALADVPSQESQQTCVDYNDVDEINDYQYYMDDGEADMADYYEYHTLSDSLDILEEFDELDWRVCNENLDHSSFDEAEDVPLFDATPLDVEIYGQQQVRDSGISRFTELRGQTEGYGHSGWLAAPNVETRLGGEVFHQMRYFTGAIGLEDNAPEPRYYITDDSYSHSERLDETEADYIWTDGRGAYYLIEEDEAQGQSRE